MPTTATRSRPTVTTLTQQERRVLYAIGCGLGVAPSELLRRARRAILRGGEVSLDLAQGV